MNEIKFEDAMKRLDEIVAKLEEGVLTLDETLDLYEEGVKLSKFCLQRLKGAEKRIEILTKDENNENSFQPFEA
ncbi:exodeoxyribonuclease VII small subunit [bacterium]|nr:exodeoxyribonuclease VII small subunit [bacterium]